MKDHLINGLYTALPNKTILSKEWISLTPSTRCVYKTMMTEYIRTGEKATGRVTWSQADLAEATAISLRTIRKCLDELLEKDWMCVYEPGGRWAKGTTYCMLVAVLSSK